MIDFGLVLFASPILLARSLVRLSRRIWFWRVAYSSALTCFYCRSAISLLGMWRCSCAYTYTGHLLRRCPHCGALPRMVRCLECGVCRMLPEKI